MNLSLMTAGRLVAGLIAVGVLSTTASAALKKWIMIPAYAGGVATAQMDRFSAATSNSKGYAHGWVYLDSQGGNCVFIEKKPVARGAALDGGWKRASPSRCKKGGANYQWEDSFTFTYNGFKFRQCNDKNGRPDSCGRDSAAIYP